MKIATLILAAAVVCAVAVPATAGERAHAVSVSPFVGGYTFDGKQHLETAPLYGLRLGYDLTKNWGFEIAGSYLATDGTQSERSVNAISYGADILYNFLPDGPFVPYITVGGGGITIGHGSGFQGGSNTDATANAGLGIKYFLTDSIALRGDARQLFLFEDHNSVQYNWQYTAGLTFLFGGKAAPAPAIAQEQPAAPTSSLSVTPGSITKGESATLSWTSHDTANCNIKPGIGSVKLQGSMTVTPATDTSYSLYCSGPGGTTSSAAKISVVAHPLPQAPPVPTSKLSVTPGAITKGESAMLEWTSENTSNCDIQPGIGAVKPEGTMTVTPAADTAYTLTCTGAGATTTTSTGNIRVTVPPVVPKKEKVCITLKIEFDTGKATIKPKYHAEIGKVAEFMKKYPETSGVIGGHTDNVGGYEYNMKLSERRAMSVKNYLIEKYGISPERLTAKGYGYTKPVATNKTKAGRQKNRRIEATFNCVVITK